MDNPNGKNSASVFEVVWRLLILIAFVMVTFPPCFWMMGADLDSSWVIGLNEASSRHLIYGRDIVFTYGPLGFILFPLELGSNLVHATLFRLGLHLLWWTSVGMLLFRVRGFSSTLLFAAALLLSGIQFGPTWDANFGLTGVIILTTLGYLMLGYIDRRPVWAAPAMIVAAAALLAKFNLGVACAGAIAVWAVIELLRDRSLRMLGRLGLLALTYAGTLGLLFRIYGGPINALGEFLQHSRELASGYSSQMSSQGSATELTIMSAVLIIAIIAAGAGILLRARYTPALLITLFPLFVLFKGAIVRHDYGHVMSSLPPMVGLAAFLLPGRIGRLQSWTVQVVVALAVVGGLWLASPSVSSVFTRGPSSWISLCRFEETRASIRTVDSIAKDRLKLPAQILSRIGSATVDVYPWDICYATANGLNWKPRYVFQSYSAFHPTLDRRCAEDYRGQNAPQYILYSHEAIDLQHPCIVDPRTWMEIYRWYDVVDQANGMLLLERRVSPRWDKVDKMGSRSIAFGERWEVPDGIQGPVILQAKLKLNLIGRLSSMLYKVYPPRIRVEYEDGTVAEHRLVWRNVRSGFLVSSLPRDSSGVRLLFEEGKADRVRAVTFRGRQGCFEQEFQVSWFRAPMSPAPPPREVPQPVAPVELNQMTWEEGMGRPTGIDPFAVFALEKPTYVRNIKVRCSLENRNPSAPLRIFWKTKDRNEFSGTERTTALIAPTGQNETVTFPIYDQVDHYRIDLEDPASVIKISEIVLRLPPTGAVVAGNAAARRELRR